MKNALCERRRSRNEWKVHQIKRSKQRTCGIQREDLWWAEEECDPRAGGGGGGALCYPGTRWSSWFPNSHKFGLKRYCGVGGDDGTTRNNLSRRSTLYLLIRYLLVFVEGAAEAAVWTVTKFQFQFLLTTPTQAELALTDLSITTTPAFTATSQFVLSGKLESHDLLTSNTLTYWRPSFYERFIHRWQQQVNHNSRYKTLTHTL